MYGEWDPWTGGKFDLGQATDSLRLIQASGTHGSSLTRLSDADRDAAFAKLAAWTGVTPVVTMPNTRAGAPESYEPYEPREPRVPPAIRRALRAH